MYYVVHETGIDTYNSFYKVKQDTSYEKTDFTKYGSDYILNATDSSHEIMKDIKLLEHVAAKKMFTKNKMDMSDLIGIVTLLMVFIQFVK